MVGFNFLLDTLYFFRERFYGPDDRTNSAIAIKDKLQTERLEALQADRQRYWSTKKPEFIIISSHLLLPQRQLNMTGRKLDVNAELHKRTHIKAQ